MDKLSKLKQILSKMDSAVIAYSGGVDSTFLAAVAVQILKDKVLAVTGVSQTYPKSELRDAKRFAKFLKIKHLIINTDELRNREFSDNPVNRCYFCKSELFSKLKKIAAENKIEFVLDGTNFDDSRDYRPGMKAKKELNVRSPLQEAGMTKEDIRKYSRKMRLPSWNKPAYACLSSRFPYGEKITKKKLSKVESAEEYMKKLGFKVLRVRHHNKIARIELKKDEIKRIINNDIMSKIANKFKNLGFLYITLDLEGFRSGSMNKEVKK